MLTKPLLLALPLLAVVIAQASPEPIPQPETAARKQDLEKSFQDLLNALPEESLHAALHSHYSQYKDGVYEHDRTAVEKVHSLNPPLASRLLSAAKVELIRRQNNTVVASVAPTSTAPAVVVPVPVTTTDSAGSTVVQTSEVLSAEGTASVQVEVTKTDAAGSTFVQTTAAPAVVLTATDAKGSTIVKTSAVSFAMTKGQVITTTNAQGSTFLTTYTPDGGLVSSIVLITTTGKDGHVVTLTSYAYVGGGPTTTPATAGAASGTTGTAGLQTGAAAVVTQRWGMEAAAVVGGAVGMAWLI